MRQQWGSRTMFGILAIILPMAGGLIGSTPAASIPPEIENPECLGINKEPFHATLMPYATLEQALAADRHASPYCRLLNGTWKFHWVKRPELRPADFYKPDFDVSGWNDISVPSNWEVLGYGTPHYRNNGYIFKKDFPHVMSEPPQNWTAYDERNPVGSYRREFEVPQSWGNRRVFLTFDGVDSAFFLWINGQKVGYSINSRNAAEFDITKYVRPGKNLVAVEVYRFSAGSFLEDQDMWRLSGIFRNVTLWSAPAVHVRDFFVKTDLDAQYKDATVEVTAKVKNYKADASGEQTVTARLFDGDGKLVAKTSGRTDALAPAQEQALTLKMPVAAPLKWTAETPNLYTLVLLEGTADRQHPEAAELLSARIGFRKVEIKGRQLLVNGTPLKLKGVNRHEQWPETGHAVSEAQMIRDLEVLKQGNCNHVRTCHYSDDPRWYELCDQWGIWLVAEANCECHGYSGRFDNEPLMRAAIIDRNVANVENFKNHPSVIIWSLGNECGRRGQNFIDAMNTIKAMDPTRPVHYERFGIDPGNPADLDGKMYGTPAEFAAIAANPTLTKPFYICEFAHAMFNSMGSLAEYCEVFDRCPAIVGGAIWEWQDQGLWNRRDPKHPILAYGGGFGDVPNDHYFIHKGVVAADRSPKPHYPEMKRAYQWIGIEPVDLAAGTVKIRNKYQFITLAGFDGEWTLSEDGVEIQHGALRLPAIALGAEATITVPFRPFQPQPGREYFLRIAFTLAKDQLWAKQGYEVAAEQFLLPISAPAAVAAAAKPVSLTQDDKAITAAGDGFTVIFDKATGTISALERNGVNILAGGGGPRLHLWRAPHRNDDMWAYKEWAKNGLDNLAFSVVNLTASQAGPNTVCVVAEIKAVGKNGFSATHNAVYTITGDGAIAVDNDVRFDGPRVPLGRLGVRLLLDKRLDRLDFLGRGPMENYADRKRGFDVGLYSTGVNEQYAYEKPMEHGNHEDIRWAALSGAGLPALLAQADGELLQVSALPHTDEQMTPVEYKIDLPKSEATVLCLCAKTLGVGSNGCGPRPLEPYIVWSQPAKFSYILRLLPAGQKPTLELGRLPSPARQHSAVEALAAGPLSAGQAARPAMGPLRVHPGNHHYFADASGKAVFLTGSHTWANFQENAYEKAPSPPPFDFNAFLAFLTKHHHNFFRLWAWENTFTPDVREDTVHYGPPMPYLRPGPELALDGKPKFDLNRFDQSYFDRMRAFVAAARDKGIYASVMLFNGFSIEAKGPGDGDAWRGHYLNGKNNLSGLDGGSNGKVHTLTDPAVTAVQEAYIRKVIDTVDDLDNVLYEITNEDTGGPANTQWQYHIIRFIKDYEKTKPKQHPVGMTVQYTKGDDRVLEKSPADWISPAAPLPKSDGGKVVINDTDHCYYWIGLKADGLAAQRAWVWKNVLRGYQCAFMDPYLDAGVHKGRNNPSGNMPDPYWDTIREALGQSRRYADRMHFAETAPHGELASTGYCLAYPGYEYLVFLPDGGEVTVDVSAAAGQLAVEWLRPVDGTVSQSGTIAGGSERRLKSPFFGDAVLYLHTK